MLLGEFGRAQGLRGEVRLKSFTADPLAIGRYGPLVGEDGRTFVLTGIRGVSGEQADMLVARVEGVATREAAEALTRTRLYAPRERLGEAEEDEFFLADLVGLEARDEAGVAMGRIVAVPNHGGGDLLEIAPTSGGATELVPFTKAFVPVVAAGDGYVVLAAVSTIEVRPDGGDDAA